MPIPPQNLYDPMAIERQRYQAQALQIALQELFLELGGLTLQNKNISCVVTAVIECSEQDALLMGVLEKYTPRLSVLDSSKKMRIYQAESGWAMEDLLR